MAYKTISYDEFEKLKNNGYTILNFIEILNNCYIDYNLFLWYIDKE